MLSSTPNVVIVGAGAMGCLFAARLAEQAAPVTLVDVDRERLNVIAGDRAAERRYECGPLY